MREVKSISEEDHRRSDIKGNPSKGGTDHRERKLIYQKEDRKER